MNLRQFAQNLADFLDYKKEEGIQTLEISAATRTALKASAKPPAPARPAAGFAAPKPPSISADPQVELQVAGKTLSELADKISTCSACPLHLARKHTFPGEGNSHQPDILFIGDAPDAAEEEQGQLFVGDAGRLLQKMIAAMGYRPDQIFMTHLVKCHPPDPRAPRPEELKTCAQYLHAQIAQIRPKVIVALGKPVLEVLLKKPVAFAQMRGKWCAINGIALMPTYSPAYLLRMPARKGEAWTDLKQVLAKLGKEPPIKQSAG